MVRADGEPDSYGLVTRDNAGKSLVSVRMDNK